LVKGTLSVETVSFLRRFPDEAGAPAAAPGQPKPELRPRPAAPQAIGPNAPVHEPAHEQPARQQTTKPPAPQATGPNAPVHEPAHEQPARQQTTEPPAPQATEPNAPQRRTEPRRPVFPETQKPGGRLAQKPGRPVFYDVTKPAPVEPAPVEQAPVEPAPIEQAPVEQAPVEPAPIEQAPVGPAPIGPAPLEPAPTEQAPIEQAHVEPAPVGSAPIEQAPMDQAPVEPAPTEQPQAAGQGTGRNIISVDLKKLDALLDLVGEITINESMVTENPELNGLELSNFHKAAHRLGKLTDELQDSVLSIRMLPISIIFQRMRRIVRDMGKDLGKDADLILVGETTEVDKTILDKLADPVMHLVRNAMDHAIEQPDKRVAAGKNVCGHIILSAQTSGNDVIVSVSDDGIGLDKNMILAKAREKGLLKKPESEYSEKEAFSLLMAPGFSTREYASEYSGRGVGLDVVRSNIEKIGGYVSIESKQGVGANILMKIPQTLAIIPCIGIAVGSDIYSVPVSNICEAFKPDPGQLVTDPTGNEMVMLRGSAYSVIRLYNRFGDTGAIKDINEGILILVEAGDRRACLLADRLIGKSQVVAKPLPPYLGRFGVTRLGVSGCTVMGDGSISLVVNVQDLIG
ncbi:MAG: chemotaxis protein CheA, partial [Clostridiales bacterium]|nr:chemotaxis protein CheA [Clostridiales bacterium]